MMAKQAALTAIIFSLVLGAGITAVQASSIDFTVTVNLSPTRGDLSVSSSQSSVSGTAPGESAALTNTGGASSLASPSAQTWLYLLEAQNNGTTMSGHLTGNGPNPAGPVQETGVNQITLQVDFPFDTLHLPGYHDGTYWIDVLAQINYTATITQDGANPFQNAAWNAYLSWGHGTYSIFQKNLDPAAPSSDTFTGSTTIGLSIPCAILWEEMSYPESFYEGEMGGSDMLTLHLEQSGQSVGEAVPLPGSLWFLASGLLGLGPVIRRKSPAF